MFDQIALTALLAGFATAFIIIYLKRRAFSSRRSHLRESYFDDCQPLFSHGTKAITATGFPRISGHHDGTGFDLQAVPDTLTFRKLPTLWLLVTIPEPIPVRSRFDMMLRPMGVETFSNYRTLPVQVMPPAGFPEDCEIRCDDPAGLPSDSLLMRHLAPFHDGRAKELVISPKGVRIVWLAEEADRGQYLLFRNAELGMTPLDPAVLQPLLDYLIRLRNDLIATAAEENRETTS